MMNVLRIKIATVLAIIVVSAVAGASYQYGWIGPLSGKTTTSSTTTKVAFFTRQATVVNNSGSSGVQILNVSVDFYKIEPRTINYELLNGTEWDYTFVILLVWKNVSPNPVHYLQGYGDENTNGSLLSTTAAHVKLVRYDGSSSGPRFYQTLNPGDQGYSQFSGPAHGTVFVVKGEGRVDVGLTLAWSTDNQNYPGPNAEMNFTASFDV